MKIVKRMIEIPEDGIVRIPIMRGEANVGERRIDLSFLPTVDAVRVVRCKNCIKREVSKFDGRSYCKPCGYSCDDPEWYCPEGVEGETCL